MDRQPDGAALLITLESKSQPQLLAGLARIQQLLPQGALLGVDEDVKSFPTGLKRGDAPADGSAAAGAGAVADS